ncbi:MAG TPA: hypothetical protein VF423_13120 [Actinomycetes bacterium]
MSNLPLDPLAATIHLRIEELRRDVAAERLSREAGRRRTRALPGRLATALRETLEAVTPSASARRGQPCPTC